MRRRSINSRAYWVILIGGMVTGMGNGSVFGAAMMCFLGRAGFADWGGWWPLSYDPRSFDGFMNWCMFVFGFAYVAMLAISLKRHDERENGPESQHAEAQHA